jgi:hypothetical protein
MRRAYDTVQMYSSKQILLVYVGMYMYVDNNGSMEMETGRSYSKVKQ